MMTKKQKKKLLNPKPRPNQKRTFTQDQVDAAFAYEINRVMANLMGSVLITLRDKHKFGNQRLSQFLADTFEQMDAISNEYVSAEDIFKTIEKETGFKYYEQANRIAERVKV